MFPHKHLYVNVHWGIMHDSQKVGTAKCLLMGGWINDMWSIHTTGYDWGAEHREPRRSAGYRVPPRAGEAEKASLQRPHYRLLYSWSSLCADFQLSAFGEMHL